MHSTNQCRQDERKAAFAVSFQQWAQRKEEEEQLKSVEEAQKAQKAREQEKKNHQRAKKAVLAFKEWQKDIDKRKALEIAQKKEVLSSYLFITFLHHTNANG